MRRRLMGMVVALALATGAIGCGDAVETVSPSSQELPTPLIDGFSSHQSSAQVEDALQRAGRHITVVEDGAPAAEASKARPPLSVRVVRVSPFELWGIEGDLRLEFIDGVLSSTWFYPRDPTKFEFEAQKRSLGAQPSQPLRLQPATELRSDVDYTGARYWAWEDINLRQKLERWIKRNA